MESKFALDQPPVDPMQEFEDECLQSFRYTVDLVVFDDFDDDGTLVNYAAGDADAGTDHNRRSHSANAYPFEFGDVYESNQYKKILHPQETASEILEHCFE